MKSIRISNSLLFGALLLLVLAGRLLLYFQLNLQYIDSDQPLMWLGASDYSKGYFNEPRYYGQNYNTMLEGLLAVPFLWLGVKVYHAVPIVTQLLFLFPFLFSAIYLFRNRSQFSGLLVLGILLCLPVEYGMVTSLPRGFVTGIFFCSLYIISFLNPANMKWLHINAALGVIAFFVNQNSLVLTFPLSVYLFANNYGKKNFYLVFVTISVTACLMYFLLDYYYVIHQQHVMMGMRLVFSLENLWQSLCSLDEKFVHISFFAPAKSFTVVLAISVALIFSYRQNKPLFFAAIALVLLLVVSMAFTKNIEGTSWPFFSFSRNYIGVPLVIALFLSLLKLDFRFSKLLVLLPVIYQLCQLPFTKQRIEKYISPRQNFYVTVFKLDFVLEAIKVYNDACKRNDADKMIVSKRFWLSNVLVYGGPACVGDYPFAIEAEDDRRLWLSEQENEKLYRRFIFVSPLSNFDHEAKGTGINFDIRRLDDYGLFLITGNKLKVKEFMLLVKSTETGD